jgi:hypothetical protein
MYGSPSRTASMRCSMTAINRPANLLTYLFGLLVLLAALGARYYYLSEYQFLDAEPNKVWQVQGRGMVTVPPDRTTTDQLVENIKKDGLAGFVARTPLGPDKDEATAHVAPLYPLFRAGIEKLATDYKDSVPATPVAAVRWVQLLLGGLTCLCYYIVAWRAFGQHQLLALLVGLVAAFYPYWIINTAELEDGVLATFLLSWSLSLGVRVGNRGGVIRGFLLGVVLAALALTRASLLPFAIIVQLWFFLRCRSVPSGWVAAFLCLIGFLGGLAPWAYHCFTVFKQPIPIVNSAWLDTWVGNNSGTDGGPYQWSMKKRLDPALAKKLEDAPVTERYALLADAVTTEIIEKPADTAKRRLRAGLQFLFGTPTMTGTLFWPGDKTTPAPLWLRPVLLLSLVAIYAFALLGWRWSYGWKQQSSPLALAIFWVPLPYLLTHADQLHASRLPWDGVLIVLAVLGLLSLLPYLGSRLLRGEAHST